MRSDRRGLGGGGWGTIAAIDLEGQEMVFLNGGLAPALNPPFSFFVRCDLKARLAFGKARAEAHGMDGPSS
jgi:hypothetical protein